MNQNNDWLWYTILGIAAVAIYKRSQTEKAKPRHPNFDDPIIKIPPNNTHTDDEKREDSTFSLWNFGFRRGIDFDGEKPQI